jgi:polyhydroxybutyrate depolymerase
MTGFSDKVKSGAAMAVYPTGTGKFVRMKLLKTWNAEHCCGYAMENDIDDIGFISALIDELVAREGADPKRIYVTGMSNGAMMTHRLGIALSDKIAAIAPVVGGLFGDELMPVSPVAALIINGGMDTSVPAAGGLGNGRGADAWDGTPLKPAAYQGSFWAKANGCDSEPVISQDEKGVVVTERYKCPKGGDVEFVMVNDNGHAWPGGAAGSRRGDVPSKSLNASDVIWDFFKEQSR